MFSRREALDACRPGSDDLARPEFAAVRAELDGNGVLERRAVQSEQFDRTVASAMQEVSIPAGLKERLLAQLAASAANPEPRIEIAPPTVGASSRMQRLIRGAAWAAGLAATIAVAVFTFTWFNGGENWAPVPIADAAVQQMDPLADVAWKPNQRPNPMYPLSSFVLASLRPPQKDVRNIAGCDGIAYRLESGRGKFASLLVLNPRSSLKGFPLKPASKPDVDTGGCAATAWAEKSRLYILVVAGNANDYRGFLKRPSVIAMR